MTSDSKERTAAKATKPTREAPTRGSVKDYQDWLVEQIRAGVDPYFTCADVKDIAWAERVVRLEKLLPFCSFCDCPDCRGGREDLSHAQTEDGRWICDVCYEYECCINAQQKAGLKAEPCPPGPGEHRPKLVGPWIKHGERS